MYLYFIVEVAGSAFSHQGISYSKKSKEEIIENGTAFISKYLKKHKSYDDKRKRNIAICEEYFQKTPLIPVHDIANKHSVLPSVVAVIAHKYNRDHHLGFTRRIPLIKKSKPVIIKNESNRDVNPDIEKRNKELFDRYFGGEKIESIASHFGLSYDSVSALANHYKTVNRLKIRRKSVKR
jgi:hypothetical protein